MSRKFNKISSFLMALVVLFSTMSFTVDMHFCGNLLVDSTIFQSEAESCSMEMKNISSEDCSTEQKKCCSSEQLVIDGQDELQLSFDRLTLNQQLFVASFIYSYTNLFEDLEKKQIPYRNLTHPPIVKQIYKLNETYLI